MSDGRRRLPAWKEPARSPGWEAGLTPAEHAALDELFARLSAIQQRAPTLLSGDYTASPSGGVETVSARPSVKPELQGHAAHGAAKPATANVMATLAAWRKTLVLCGVAIALIAVELLEHGTGGRPAPLVLTPPAGAPSAVPGIALGADGRLTGPLPAENDVGGAGSRSPDRAGPAAK